MSSLQFTDHDMDVLLLTCRAYDAGIVIGGVVAVLAGHLAGGAGVAAIGAVPLLYTLLERARHRARTPEKSCTRR